MSAALALLWAATSSAAVATSSAASAPAPELAPPPPKLAPAPALEVAQPPPPPTPPPPACLGAYLRAASVVPTDPSFDAVSTLGALLRVEAGALWLADPSWSVELGLAYGASEARALSRYDLALSVGGLEAAVAYRVTLPWQLEAHARAQLLADLGGLSIDDGSSTPLSASSLGIGGALTAGLALRLPLDGPEARLSFDAGYQLHSGLAFGGLARDAAGGADPPRVERGVIDVGGIGLSGFAWRLGASIAF